MPLAALMIFIGLYPKPITDVTRSSVSTTVNMIQPGASTRGDAVMMLAASPVPLTFPGGRDLVGILPELVLGGAFLLLHAARPRGPGIEAHVARGFRPVRHRGDVRRRDLGVVRREPRPPRVLRVVRLRPLCAVRRRDPAGERRAGRHDQPELPQPPRDPLRRVLRAHPRGDARDDAARRRDEPHGHLPRRSNCCRWRCTCSAVSRATRSARRRRR